MRTLLTAIGLFVLSGLQAQTNDWFAPVGATWTYYSYTDGPPWVYHQRPYFQGKVVKDSVIFGKQCRKLQAFEADGTLRENSTVWLHVDSNRIYFLEEDTFLLFFDRSLKKGDTINYHIPINYRSFDYSCCVADTNRNWWIRIDSVILVQVGTMDLMRWNFSYLEALNVHEPFWEDRYFTEKIGIVPFFGVGEVCCLGGFWGDFHCYEDQTTFINTDTVDCTYPVGIASPESESIQIAPNPTNGHFEITLPASSDLTSTKASVYSLDGRLIREVDLPDRTNKLNFDLPTGLYFIQVHSNERQYIKRLSFIR